MPIEEYDRLNVVLEMKQQHQVQEETKFLRDNADEIKAKYRRETLKIFAPRKTVKEVKEEEERRESYEAFEPETAARPIGQWQTVPT